MKKLIVATCAAALMSAVSFGPASAQTTGPAGGQDAAMKSNSPMNAQAKAKKSKKKKGAMNESGAGTTTGSSGAASGGAGSANSDKK